LYLVVFTVIGGAIVWLFEQYQPSLRAWITSDPALMRGRARTLVAVTALILFAPALGSAGYLWRFGRRIVDEARFPPDGARVTHDMIVLRGDPARRRGRLFQALGVAIGVAVAVMTIIMWRLTTLVANG
jgi:hypothetical protein